MINRPTAKKIIAKLRSEFSDLKVEIYDYGWTVTVRRPKKDDKAFYICREYRPERDMKEGWYCLTEDATKDLIKAMK